MGLKVSLDTNIFIAVKNKETKAGSCKKILDAIEKKEIQAILSTIIIAEVLVGFYQNNEFDEIEEFINNATQNYDIVPVSIEIARYAAQIRSITSIKLPDAIIIATSELSKVDALISNDMPNQKKIKQEILTPDQFLTKFLFLEEKKDKGN
jgi:predicted nucleic acid-binding protein